MPCDSSPDTSESYSVHVPGTVVNAHDLKPGDKFRALGPVQTVRPEGVTSYDVLTAEPGEWHYLGKDSTSGKTFILVEKAIKWPQFWPPKFGDVWRDESSGNEYFIRATTGASTMNAFALENSVRKGKKFKLVHRRGRSLGTLC